MSLAQAQAQPSTSLRLSDLPALASWLGRIPYLSGQHQYSNTQLMPNEILFPQPYVVPGVTLEITTYGARSVLANSRQQFEKLRSFMGVRTA